MDKEELSDTVSELGSNSVASSTTSQRTVIMVTEHNIKSILRIDARKDEQGAVSAGISDTRLATKSGTQDDHDIPYRFMLEFVAKKISGRTFNDAPKVLDAAFRSTFPKIIKEDKFPKIPETQKNNDRKIVKAVNNISSEESAVLIREMKQSFEKRLTADQKMAELFKNLEILAANSERASAIVEQGTRENKIKMVEDYTLEMVGSYQTMPDISHPKTGKKGTQEGKNVHDSLVALKAIDEFKSTSKQSDIEDSSEQKKEFMKKCLATNGEFVDGIHLIFPKEEGSAEKVNIKSLRAKFHLSQRVKSEGEEFIPEKVDKFFKAMEQKVNDPAIIGNIIEKPFDFSKNQLNANKNTLGSKDLVAKTASYFTVLSGCFPNIDFNGSNQNPPKKYIKSFLENMNKNQEWSINVDDSSNKINTAINDKKSAENKFLDELEVKREQGPVETAVAIETNTKRSNKLKIGVGDDAERIVPSSPVSKAPNAQNYSSNKLSRKRKQEVTEREKVSRARIVTRESFAIPKYDYQPKGIVLKLKAPIKKWQK